MSKHGFSDSVLDKLMENVPNSYNMMSIWKQDEIITELKKANAELIAEIDTLKATPKEP